MRKRPYKIRELASLLLAGIVVVGGAFTLLTAPNQLASEDQKQLQKELQENTALLEKGSTLEHPASLVPPVIMDEDSAKSIPIESHSQEKKSITFTAIGDSVMLGAVPEIQRVLPGAIIDAKEFRQVWDVKSVIHDLDGNEKLFDTVVIALGGNGSFSKSLGQELIDTLGVERTIYWIAPFGQYLTWQESTQQILHELAEENKNLTILNWPEFASGHTEWFYDDGMHLNAVGQTEYAEFMLEHLCME